MFVLPFVNIFFLAIIKKKEADWTLERDLTEKNKRVVKCVSASSHRASPRRSPTACGCWVCKPGGPRRLVCKQPGLRPNSVAPGTECTEHTHTHTGPN